MPLTIGEITNEVELTAAAGPAPAGPTPAARSEWTRRAAYRALADAVARDGRRTAVVDRDV